MARTAPVETHTRARSLSRLSPEERSAALLALWLSGKAETTVRAYRRDLNAWAEWMGAPTPAALRELLSMHHGDANALGLAYRAHMVDAGLAPSTVNRRLAALRSVVTAARTVGMIGWALDVKGVSARAYRDTRGPGVAGYRAMVAALDEEGNTARARRDRALLALLYTMALRRAEAVGLDMEDVDLEARRLWITGKGKAEPEPVSIPEPTAAALEAWIAERGDEPGPVFVSLSRATGGRERLHLDSVTRRIRRLGKRAGVRVTPHGLRHAGITRALDLTGGNVRQVRALSRHAKVETVLLYDDARTDGAGDLSALLAADAG